MRLRHLTFAPRSLPPAGRSGRSTPPRFTCALGLVGGIFLSGCQVLPEPRPDLTRYFLLSMPPPAEPAGPAAAAGPVVGLRPIELPDYLRTSRSLVVARGPNEIDFRDYDRWAEPLEAGLARAMREALAATDHVGRTSTFPFSPDQPRDFDITIRIRHCEGVEGAAGRFARFVATYEITRPDPTGELVQQGVYAAPQAPWDGDSASLAALLGDAAVAAARAIASKVPARP